MMDTANDGSTLQVGDILAEFFAKKIEEMEEAETNSSEKDSDSNSQFSEKRKESKMKKKHKHKKSKKKNKHSSKHKHSHKSRKRKHTDDESRESHKRHKRHKLEDYEEKVTYAEEDDTVTCDTALPSTDAELETVAIASGIKTITECTSSAANENAGTNCKASEKIMQMSSSSVTYNSTKNDEGKSNVLSSFQDKINSRIEVSDTVHTVSQTDATKNVNCEITRTRKIGDQNGNGDVDNDSCANSNYTLTATTLPSSDFISSALTTNSFTTYTVARNSVSEIATADCTNKLLPISNSNLIPSSSTLGTKPRKKIIIKDLSCCQILQKVSEKEKEKLDSLEEGEITSEEESDRMKEESQSASSEDVSFYNLEIPKGKKFKRKKEKHKHKKKKKSSRRHLRRSKNSDSERHHQHERKHVKTIERSRSPSPSDREPYDLREKIDKARLLKVAQKNVLMMLEQGTLPKGVKIDALKQEQLLAMRTGGKSVQELTDFCRALSQKDRDDSSSDASQDKWNEDVDTPFIHHPFKLREHHPIKLNIKNAIQLPIKSPAEKVADAARLRTQFPVSSGSQHRIKELQWVPVEKDEKPASKQASLPIAIVSTNSSLPVVSTVSNVVEPRPQPAVSTVEVYNPPYTSLPTAYVQPMRQSRNTRNQDCDISTIVAQRLRAVRRLQENENDVEALNQLYKVQRKMQEWVQSKQLPGQYTGSTDVRMLSPEELRGPVPVWVKKDQFSRAMPVTEGIGMHLLRKMGWNPGEGLGKNKEGVLEPLLPDIKTDKRGLISDADVSKKILPPPIKKDLSGKHPVSVLMELCSKRKWGMPVFELIDENGPDHRKTFLFKVRINNVEYQPTCSSPNKKHAKAQAATVCLQALGLIPRDLNNPL